jgi:hypothetical protein
MGFTRPIYLYPCLVVLVFFKKELTSKGKVYGPLIEDFQKIKDPTLTNVGWASIFRNTQ